MCLTLFIYESTICERFSQEKNLKVPCILKFSHNDIFFQSWFLCCEVLIL